MGIRSGHGVGWWFSVGLHEQPIMLEIPFSMGSLDRFAFASVAFVSAFDQL